MKLYDSRRAPNPRRVRWVMAEKAVDDIEVIDVDIFRGEHKTPEYRARAGTPQVPVLEFDDGSAITESLAICRYIEHLHPEPNMFGRDPREVAEIEMWTRRVEMMLATPLMLAVRHSHPALAALEQQQPVIAESNLKTANAALRLFDRRLADSPFIGGDRVTIADVLAATAIDFARMVKFRPPEELEHVGRWYAAMMERPAAKAGV